MLKVLLVDDHALVRDGLTQALHEMACDRRPVCVACARSAEQALEIIGADADFDLMVLDLMLPGMSGVELLEALRERQQAIPVLITSGVEDRPAIQRALRLGAAGFASKSLPTEDFIGAVRIVLDGGMFVPPAYQHFDGERNNACDSFGLTPARRRVLELLVQGKSNREIAKDIGVAHGTVKLHVHAILRALGVSSRTQAVVVATRHGGIAH
jgi:DNA-binding NarL/FixJ family response regulator